MTRLYQDPFGPPWRCNNARLILAWQGSIFQFFWIEWMVATAACAAALCIWYVGLNAQSVKGIGASLPYLANAVSYMTSRFQAALSLMLGFYTSTLYNRWWAVRNTEGIAFGRINDIAVQVAAYIRDDERLATIASARSQSLISGSSQPLTSESESGAVRPASVAAREPSANCHKEAIDKAREIRVTLVRWVNLAHALAVGELYEKKPNEFSSLENIKDCGLLTDQEYQYMLDTPRSRYVAPFVWFLDLAQELKAQGLCGVTDASLVTLKENVQKIRGGLATLSLYRSVPVPLSYRQLVNVTVRLYMVVVCFAGGFASIEEYGNEVFSSNSNGRVFISPALLWFTLPFCFEYFMFVGWLSIADALANPFRVWADEFEWENYVKSAALASDTFVTRTIDASPAQAVLRNYPSAGAPESDDNLGCDSKRKAAFQKWESELAGDTSGHMEEVRALARARTHMTGF